MIAVLILTMGLWFLNRARNKSWEWPFYVGPVVIFFELLLLAAEYGPITPSKFMFFLFAITPFMVYPQLKYYVYHASVTAALVFLLL